MQHTVNRTATVTAGGCTIALLPELSTPYFFFFSSLCDSELPRARGTVASGTRSVKHRDDGCRINLTGPTKHATTRTSWGTRLHLYAPRGSRYEVVMVTYADVIAKLLADAGIEYIFGMPGSRASVELI